MKRAIAHSALQKALCKSCHHKVDDAFLEQVSRLRVAGYTPDVVSSVTEGLLRDVRDPRRKEERRVRWRAQDKKKTAVVPYVHDVSHRLKKIGESAGVRVVFSAPEKLSGLCSSTSRMKEKRGCTTDHKRKFVPCVQGVVYAIPLTCGRKYVGQTGRCLNERLREHYYSVQTTVSGHLGIHVRDCECRPLFENTAVLARSRDQRVREIIEAEEIKRSGDACVSMPSLHLSDKELLFLASHGKGGGVGTRV